MATDTAPPVPEGPPDPPASPAASTATAPAGDTGIMAALMAAVEPARPVSATGAGARPAGDDPAAKADPDGAVDRSSLGVTSESFKALEDLTGADSDAAGTRYKEGVIKTLVRAGATRWAKGGGTANKRLDLEKARAGAHQVKEARTTTVMKSPGLPTRNGSGGAGGGGRNSTGSGSTGTGRGAGSGATGGGGRGSSGSNGSGGRGSSGSTGSGGSGGGRGTSGNGGGGSSKDTGSKGTADSGSKGKGGSSGDAGAGGKAGKDGKSGASGSSGGSSSGGNAGGSKGKADKGKGAKADLEKGGGSGRGSGGSSGSGGGSGSSGGAGKNGNSGKSGVAGGSNVTDGGHNRSPLQRSRETGHGDGSAVRDAVDHVKAYAKGAKDGYQDKKRANRMEHARLDKAHADHKAKQQEPKKSETRGTTVTGTSRTLVVPPPDEGDDGVSTDVKPLRVKLIDPNALTLDTAGAAGSISRKELRNFKQYERKLEAKETRLIRVAEACRQLEAAAQDEAKDCQRLAEQARSVKGGEKLAGKLTRLADKSKAQATEAGELAKRAKRAAEMCKVVLTNIGTRYAPLYKAVVDSDETKPAELRFYNDKGSYAPAA
ncbi:hypothetical protein Scani_34260 [Streptomyces caniferus]|uniref:Uncharacterized protein n=1 Tax=Streptomyces caniferus TaxID=285557 RepID=A0A640S7W3_9ACTN|nr:hypothetical protein [Streptomyces caniferus]GFE07158.1 hypothetical protein Scani_34260 [Streptomyces caniferus]